MSRAIRALVAGVLVLMACGCVVRSGNGHDLAKSYTIYRTNALEMEATNDRLSAENEGMRLAVEALKLALEKRDRELALERVELSHRRVIDCAMPSPSATTAYHGGASPPCVESWSEEGPLSAGLFDPVVANSTRAAR